MVSCQSHKLHKVQKKMKILYFTTQDVDSGLFYSQVYENLIGLKELENNIDVTLFVVNRPWKFFKHRPILNDLKKSNINIKYVPLCPPIRYFTKSIILNKLYIFYFTIIFKIFVKFNNYDVIHCRHYIPSLVCKRLRLKNILFDVRSLSLFEYVQAGKIKYKSRNYFYWLKQEKSLFKYVNSISVVSKSMTNYIKSKSKSNVYYCPIIVNPKKIYFSKTERYRLRKKWNWHRSNIYVYSGSFGLYGINKFFLSKLIYRIKEMDSKSKFLFLISHTESEFKSFINQFNFIESEFKYYSVKSSELYSYLSASDVGIHALPNQMDSFTRLGTKVVEYWCCGLPTLLNKFIGEAVKISTDHSLGNVIDLEKPHQTNKLSFKSFSRERIRNKSLQLFSKTLVLNNYLKIYKNIISLK